MDYLLGLWMERAKQAPGRAKKVLALAVVLNVALLGFFKYADFFVENLNALTGLAIPALQIPLPIGISFYTFQAMSYPVSYTHLFHFPPVWCERIFFWKS